jgi:hypothetical protein
MVGKPQLAMLEAIHDALDVPRASLYAGLHAGIGAAADAAHEPILVSEAVRETLHPIPRPPTEEPATVMPDRLARIRAETESVQAMLADIFVDDEVLSEVPEPAGEGPFAGLDAEHSVLLARLLSRQEWSHEEFEHAASAAGLMPGGAMETINEWAFDRHGDALLDDGDPIVVNRALLETDADAIVAE